MEKTRVKIFEVDVSGESISPAAIHELELVARTNGIQIDLLRPGADPSDCASVWIERRHHEGWHLTIHGNGSAGAIAITVQIPEVGKPRVTD